MPKSTSTEGKMTSVGKRKATLEPGPDDCAVCLEAMTDTDAKFIGPCKHMFHVQCAEQNFVVGRKTCCPCCRAEFQHAPGFVAMARAGARMHGSSTQAPAPNFLAPPVVQSATGVIPDIPVGGEPVATVGTAGPDFVKASIITDARTVRGTQNVTALLKLAFKDDDDAAPVTMAADFVLLADVSASMAGTKLEAVRDALLKLSDMFNPQDRVAIVAFNHAAVQMTALSPLVDPTCEAAFRRAAMEITATGGTNVEDAVRMASRILDARTTRNPLAHVLLLADGQDPDAMGCAEVGRDRGVVWTTMGFGDDHDAELLTDLATRGRGMFTFVERADMLDETLAAYTGHSTRVLASDVRVTLAPQPGVVISSVRCPGEQTTLPDGSLEVALGHASVAGTTEILITMKVTCPDGDAAFDALVVTASAEAGRVTTPPFTMAFTKDTATEELEHMHLALNREQMAVAAMAVAEAMAGDHHATAQSIISAARSVLVGSAVARIPVEEELDALAGTLHSAEAARICSFASASRARTQTNFTSPSQMTSPGKGARVAHHRMSCRKGM